MVEPIIVRKPPLIVVGMEASFVHALSPDANNQQVLGKLWEAFLHPSRDIAHRAGRSMYGIIYSQPEQDRGHPDERQYIAAVAVSQVDDLPAGMVSHEIPETDFAVVTHHGPIAGIGETVSQLYGTWLHASGYTHSGIADVEVYDHRFNPTAEDSVMEYWISVHPKTDVC